METRSRQRAHPLREIIDLTSSPRRPPPGVVGERYVDTHGYSATGSDGYAYVPEVVRNNYHEHPAGARPYAYISESDRMYQRRHQAHEYIPLRR